MTETTTERLIDVDDLDADLFERMMATTLTSVRDGLNKHISREQIERVCLASEAHTYDVMEALEHLGNCVSYDVACPQCGDYDCDDHGPEQQMTFHRDTVHGGAYVATCHTCIDLKPAADREYANS